LVRQPESISWMCTEPRMLAKSDPDWIAELTTTFSGDCPG